MGIHTRALLHKIKLAALSVWGELMKIQDHQIFMEKFLRFFLKTRYKYA